MAASVRVEQRTFTDPRLIVLGQLIGSNEFDALGRMCHVWSQCTEFQAKVLPGMLVDAITRKPGMADAIVKSGLGEWNGDGAIRIKGTEGRIEWLGRKREAGLKGASAGGKARAANAERNANGTFNQRTASANPAHQPAHDQPTASAPTSANPAPLALALSLTLKEKDICAAEAAPLAPPAEIAEEADPEPTPTPKPKRGVREETENVIGYLNKMAERQFEADTEEYQKLVKSLLRTRSVRDLRLVVWSKTRGPKKWLGNPEMEEYLRPDTLFRPKKFASYLEQAQREYEALKGDGNGQQGNGKERGGSRVLPLLRREGGPLPIGEAALAAIHIRAPPNGGGDPPRE